jgi:DNA repair protein RadB
VSPEAPVPTGCDPLDELLGGGLERGSVTQFYGPPAAGKTNVCLSAAVEVAAEGGTAVYLDTEGVSPERFEQVLSARAADPERASANVVLTAIHDFEEQSEAVKDASEFADAADLIVLDSATGFYRLRRDNDDEGETLREVARQTTHLLSLARKHELAVLLTNQVYTDPEGERARPLGGHTLEHWTGTVVRLERFRGGNRRATLEKHRAKPAGETARFRITGGGIEAAERRGAERAERTERTD